MKDTASHTARVLLDVLEQHGVREIVLSPGSRNAPVLISCSQRRSLKKTIIPDERTAAFTALGKAMVSGEPVALACTSGTALYNYAPAVAEALYQHIPLIVISADRPLQWIDQDDSQTLRQYGSLANIVKGSYDLPSYRGRAGCANPDYETEGDWYANRVTNEAMLTALGGCPGPVHINLQLDTPLGSIEERAGVSGPDDYPERVIRQIEGHGTLPPHLMNALAEELHDKKILLSVGFMAPSDSMNKAVNAFAALPNVTVFAETLSNLHLQGDPQMTDTLLTRIPADWLAALRPDIVISIGGALVSRMLKDYLRKSEGTQHWTLGDTAVGADAFQRLATHIDIAPDRFLGTIAGYMRSLSRKRTDTPVPDYKREWQQWRQKVKEECALEISATPWSELKAIRRVCESLPRTWNLFLSNGTCVRYAQICMDRVPHACYGNRGVSGIDGTNATAYGAASAFSGTTLLLTGDMSFGYCPQILSFPTDNADLRIIVMNNSGGGIFRFVAQTRDLEMREEYFCAPSEQHIPGLAKVYGWNYFHADDEESLGHALKGFLGTRRSILEIKADPQQSAETLRRFLRT